MEINLLFIGGLGGTEIILIFAVILLLFGGRKIPELMRGLGKGIREFNTARASLKTEIEEGMREGDKPAEPQKEPAKVNHPEKEPSR